MTTPQALSQNTSQDLLSTTQDGVLTLTLNRPERRNAMNEGLLKGLAQALAAAQADSSLRAVVLTGAGEQAFCAGADLQTGTSFSFDYSQPYMGFANVFRQARALTVPLIGRINGTCMAGGMGLMSMCDMVVSTPKALFGLPEVKVGLFPAQVLSVFQHLIPRRLLNEMCITGEPITAAQALEAGLLNYVDEDLDGRMAWLLARITDKSPAAIRRGLYTLKTAESLPFEQSMSFTESQIGLFALTEDAKEGQLAFREKRKASWPGR
jgi:enoyl-CoA hydratase/carnithine racemase